MRQKGCKNSSVGTSPVQFSFSHVSCSMIWISGQKWKEKEKKWSLKAINLRQLKWCISADFILNPVFTSSYFNKISCPQDLAIHFRQIPSDFTSLISKSDKKYLRKSIVWQHYYKRSFLKFHKNLMYCQETRCFK